ncbi:hypothetical protein D3C84_394360 [compost metagenome]
MSDLVVVQAISTLDISIDNKARYTIYNVRSVKQEDNEITLAVTFTIPQPNYKNNIPAQDKNLSQ